MEHQLPGIRPRRYGHYKGKESTVLGVAQRSEMLGVRVVYRQEYGDNDLWVQSVAMFAETVIVDGKRVQSFVILT